jgi:transcriptional regulator with XRE-family HTH domain
MDLGRALKIYRVMAGIKQKELARRLDTSSSYLSLVESGKRTPSLHFLSRAAQEVNVPVELLLVEAAQQRGGLSQTQMEFIERAKEFLRLAARIEQDGTGKKAAPEAAG